MYNGMGVPVALDSNGEPVSVVTAKLVQLMQDLSKTPGKEFRLT